MKTFHQLKQMAAVLLLAAGMTSCLKTSEPNFEVAPAYAYILQEGTGDNARFTPYIYLYGNKPINSNMLATRCEFEEKNYYFEEVSGSAGYYLETPPFRNSSVDTVKTWEFTIKVSSKVASETEKAEYFANTFWLRSSKPLGKFNPAKLEYENNTVTATWDKVENASAYVLMYRAGSSNMWLPGNEFRATGKDERQTGTASILIEKGKSFQIAIAAVNNSLFTIMAQETVTGNYAN